MSKNPFSKIPVPTKLDPRTVSISEFTKYQSYQMKKIAATLRTYKKSLLYIGGTLALSLAFTYWANTAANQSLFGRDYRGGSYLNLSTPYDEDHYAYNRQFQRMHVLGEAKIADNSRHSKQLLADLGVELTQKGAPHIPKKAPHEKFY